MDDATGTMPGAARMGADGNLVKGASQTEIDDVRARVTAGQPRPRCDGRA